MEEIPNQQVQDIAEQYCLCRPLYRPKTTIKKAAVYTILFFGVSIILMFIIVKLLNYSGISSHLPLAIIKFKQNNPLLTAFFVWLLIVVLLFFTMLRFIIIGLVHLYQHYASESIRRKCLLMPTCSEYMILAVKNYGAILGLYKGIYRLLTVCRGNVYRIDYPFNQ